MCLRDLVQRQNGTKCPGTKVEKEAALTRHYGYWITISFQGFVHSWLIWLGRRWKRRHHSEIVALLRMPRRARAMQDWAGMARVEQDSAYTRDELSAMSDA
jgi:hypothetical protein